MLQSIFNGCFGVLSCHGTLLFLLQMSYMEMGSNHLPFEMTFVHENTKFAVILTFFLLKKKQERHFLIWWSTISWDGFFFFFFFEKTKRRSQDIIRSGIRKYIMTPSFSSNVFWIMLAFNCVDTQLYIVICRERSNTSFMKRLWNCKIGHLKEIIKEARTRKKKSWDFCSYKWLFEPGTSSKKYL